MVLLHRPPSPRRSPAAPVASSGPARVLAALLAALLLAACRPEPIPVPTGADAPCADLAFQGFPRLEPGMRNAYFVCHNGFALQYAVPVHSALWVVQRLRARDLDEPRVTRDNHSFRPDAFLPEGITPDPDRFTRTGYDRGHLAPAADFSENAPGMSHSFYTSNIVPQDPGNNRGVWARLESNVRAWALRKGELYVVTGPIFYADDRPYTPRGWLAMRDGRPHYVIEEYQRTDQGDEDDARREERRRRKARGASAIAVPSHLYKVLYDPAARTAVAFVLPNLDVPESDLARYATTVAEVERLTSLRFFPDLPLDEQARIKTRVDPAAWVLER